MDHAWIDRRTSQPNDDKACQRSHFSKGQNHDQNSRCDNSLSQTDHLDIIELHGNKSADSTSSSNAYVEQAGKFRCQFHRNMLIQSQIAAGPQSGGLFYGTIAEETEQNLLNSRNPHCIPQRNSLCLFFSSFTDCHRAFLPQRQTEHQNHGQRHLQYADDPVTHIPAFSPGQHISHDIRSKGCPQSPHTVEPAHMTALIMKRYIVIQRGIHTSGSKTIRDRPQTQRHKGMADGKSKQCHRCHRHADSGYLSGS